MRLDERETSRNSWQSYMLGIGAVLIGAGIIGLTSTLSGVREDLAVVKRDIQYLTEQSKVAERFRERVEDRMNAMESRLQKIETDNSRRIP